VTNGKRFLRQVTSAYSYLSSNDVRVHFGLGAATSVQEIDIRWPDGTMQKYPGMSADRIVTFKKQP